MIRKKVPEAIAKFYQTLGVDGATCTRCMVCVKDCPTGAITIDGVVADPHKFPRYQGPEGPARID